MPPKDCRFGDPEEYRSTFAVSEGVIELYEKIVQLIELPEFPDNGVILPGIPVIKNQGIDCNYLVASGP